MTRYFLIFIALFFLFSCKRNEGKKQIIIEGHVKNLPDGKVYLTEAHYWNINLDSTISKNGDFHFEVKNDSDFYPYMAAIKFSDPKSQFGIGALTFSEIKADGFYLEPGITLI